MGNIKFIDIGSGIPILIRCLSNNGIVKRATGIELNKKIARKFKDVKYGNIQSQTRNKIKDGNVFFMYNILKGNIANFTLANKIVKAMKPGDTLIMSSVNLVEEDLNCYERAGFKRAVLPKNVPFYYNLILMYTK